MTTDRLPQNVAHLITLYEMTEFLTQPLLMHLQKRKYCKCAGTDSPIEYYKQLFCSLPLASCSVYEFDSRHRSQLSGGEFVVHINIAIFNREIGFVTGNCLI